MILERDKMKRSSINKMYCFTLSSHVIGLICGILGAVIMLIYSCEFINYGGKILGLSFVIVIVGSFFLLIIFSIKALVTLLKDLKSLINNGLISIIGKVLKFERNREPESGTQINDHPVVLVLDSNEIISLNVNEKVVIGGTYKFNYLKNFKIAEFVKRIC